MNEGTLEKIVTLGALTGIRSMAGAATLALRHRGLTRRVMVLAAVGEMLADKTSFVGDRIHPLPLAARAIMGAGVGALIAREHDRHALLGATIGAATAVVAAHLAYQARTRLPWSNVAGGLLEDSLVILIGSNQSPRH